MMEKVLIEPGCVSCGLRQVTCPDVFTVVDGAHIMGNAGFKGHKKKTREVAEGCPVHTIEDKE